MRRDPFPRGNRAQIHRLLLPLWASACGRLDFDPKELGRADAPPAPDGLSRCFEDDFDDQNIDDWIDLTSSWLIAASGGPDGSATLGSDGSGTYHTITHPQLAGVDAARVELDFEIRSPAFGDFVLNFAEAGHADEVATLTARGYRAAVYPVTGDNPVDFIQRMVPAYEDLVTRPPVSAAPGWHHVVVERDAAGALAVTLDGSPYLASPPDLQIAPPFDVAISLYAIGAIDNVRLDCRR